MIDASDQLKESFSDDVQIVRPEVKAWMADLRTLENLDIYTSSHTLDKQIKDRDPLVYLKFDKVNFSEINYNKSASAYMPNGSPSHLYILNRTDLVPFLTAGRAITITSEGLYPTDLTVGQTYYIQDPIQDPTGTTEFYFYLNTSRANAIANSSTGKVNMTYSTTSTITFDIELYYDNVKDYGSKKLNFSFNNNSSQDLQESLNLDNYSITEDAIEVIEPKYLTHTFYNNNSTSLGFFTNDGDTDPELRYYSFSYSPGSQWYTNSGKAYWFNSSSKFNTIPVYFYINMRSLDHFVDFKTTNVGFDGGLGAIVRYIDNNNYIYCRQTRSGGGTNLDTIAIYKVINGISTMVTSVDSTWFSTSNYYRFEAKYNTFTIYNLGTSMPNQSTTGTIVTDGTKSLTCYIDDPVFRTSDATSVGLINAGVATYNPAYVPGGSTFTFDYFGSYAFNYLIGSQKFEENTKIIEASTKLKTYTSNSPVSSLGNLNNFTISFLFKKDQTGSNDDQTIFFTGDSTYTNARISYIKSTGKLRVKFTDTNNNIYTLNSINSISNNILYNVQIIKNETYIYLYINNSLDTSLNAGTNFSLKNESLAEMSFGGDYYYTSTPAPPYYTYNTFRGFISEFAIFDYAFQTIDVECFNKCISNSGKLYANTANNYCNSECIIDGQLEETLAFAFTNMLSSSGEYSRVDGKYFLSNAETNVSFFDNIEDNYGWISRVQSDSSGNFSNPDFIEMSFDNSPCNKIFLSTSYIYGRINNFSYVITKSDNTTITGTSSFSGDSITFINLNDDYQIKKIRITPTSTKNAYDYARLFSVNPIWEVDLSDYIISFSLDKVRENFDASLPIGATSANSGSITLDNTDKVFNIFGNSLYGKYAIPDVKLFLSLTHQISSYSTEETIPIAYDMYADTWSFDNSTMTVELSFRDYSKYLQEKNIDGYVGQGISAGRGISEILMKSGFPRRKINYIEKYEDNLFEDNPYVYIPFSSSYEDIMPPNVSVFNTDDAYLFFPDKCGKAEILRTVYTDFGIGGNLVYSESLSVQGDLKRQSDEGLMQTFEPILKNRSYYAISENQFKNVNTYTSFDFFSGQNNEWTFELLHYLSDGTTTSGNYYKIFYDDSSKPAFELSFQSTSTQIKYRWGFMDSSDTYHYIYSDWISLNLPIHIVVRKTHTTSNIYDLFINGNLVATTTLSSTISTTNSKELKMKYGYFSHLTLYNKSLSNERINSHYISSAATMLSVYRYVYASNQTYWDAMLSIATADLGMFYLDEYGDFQYEYRDTFHQNFGNRYQTSQYDFSDDLNIIKGSYVNEIQSNKVSIKVNNISLSSYTNEVLWSAPSNESLAVAKLAENVYLSSTSILLDSTSNPQWADSGYFKIDNEIIKYSLIIGNYISGIERGQFGTEIANHASGSKVREVRNYDALYSSSPAVSVKYPLITNEKIDVEYYSSDAFKTNIAVSVSDSAEFGSVEMLNGKNPLTEIEDTFEIVGIPVSISASTELISSLSSEIRENIRKYGIKELQIDNPYIQNKKYAAIIGNHIISYYKNPIKNISLEVLSVPILQLGDLITVVKLDDLEISNEKFWIVSDSLSYDGALSQNLSLLAYSETVDPPEFTFGSTSYAISSGLGGTIYYPTA